jgi:hypothetical protein
MLVNTEQLIAALRTIAQEPNISDAIAVVISVAADRLEQLHSQSVDNKNSQFIDQDLSNEEIDDYLFRFTIREDALLTRLKNLGVDLPDYFINWQLWYGDSLNYISALTTFVEDLEKN